MNAIAPLLSGFALGLIVAGLWHQRRVAAPASSWDLDFTGEILLPGPTIVPSGLALFLEAGATTDDPTQTTDAPPRCEARGC